jgi:hypothetical protein
VPIFSYITKDVKEHGGSPDKKKKEKKKLEENKVRGGTTE